MRNVDAMAISSQQTYHVIMSPANTTPSALPTYTSAAVFSARRFSCHEKTNAATAQSVKM